MATNNLAKIGKDLTAALARAEELAHRITLNLNSRANEAEGAAVHYGHVGDILHVAYELEHIAAWLRA